MCVLMCILVCSCSKGNKGTAAKIANKEITGDYIGIDDNSTWCCTLNADGTGEEMALYANSGVAIRVPLQWEEKDGKITFTFKSDEAEYESDESSQTADAVVEAAMSGYSVPRVCTLTKTDDGKTKIDGEGLYPTYIKTE